MRSTSRRVDASDGLLRVIPHYNYRTPWETPLERPHEKTAIKIEMAELASISLC
jgi:hypothetical protein